MYAVLPMSSVNWRKVRANYNKTNYDKTKIDNNKKYYTEYYISLTGFIPKVLKEKQRKEVRLEPAYHLPGE